MSNTKIDKSTAALAAAKESQALAQQRNADAITAITTAELEDAAIRERLATGDSTVSGMDLSTASANIDRARLLAQGAATGLANAKAVTAPLVAAHWAEAVGNIVDPDTQLKANAKAVKAITAALVELAAATAAQAATVKQATADAKAAGVVNFKDPALHVGMGTMYVGANSKPTDALTYDGHHIFLTDISELVNDALVDGAKGAGFRADGEYGRVRVRALAAA